MKEKYLKTYMEKKSAESWAAWWKEQPTWRKVLLGVLAVNTTLATTAAATAGVSYLVNPDGTKKFFSRKVYNLLDSMEQAARKTEALKKEQGTIRVTPSVSATGPGVLVRHKDYQIALKGDFGGGGLMYTYSRDQLADTLKSLSVSDKYVDKIRKYAPPHMYTGLEFSPMLMMMPVAFGADLRPEGAKEVAEGLSKLKQYYKVDDGKVKV